PEGGAIFRDAGGAPTGVLQERANELADRAVPPATEADCDAATLRAQDEALKRGVTGVESLEQASSYAALRRARERGKLTLRALGRGGSGGCDPCDRRSGGARRARCDRADPDDIAGTAPAPRTHPARTRGGPRTLRRSGRDRVDAADPLHERSRPRRPLLGP